MAKEVITDLAREKRRRAKWEHPPGISRKDAAEIARALLNGKSVCCQCHIGFMIGTEVAESGLLSLNVPSEGWPIRGKAEAEFVRAAISGWQKRLDEYDAQDDTPS
jgi:hypothetical protein